MRAARIAVLMAGAAAAASAFCLGVSADTVTLTPAQTVALYGTEINVKVRRSGLDETSNVSFHYAFPLSSVGNQAQGGGFTNTSGLNMTIGLANEIKALNGCVYIAQESDWGGGAFPTWNSHNTNVGLSSAELNTSVNIGQYTDIAQYVAWSCGTWDYVREQYTNTWPLDSECPWEARHNAPLQGSTTISSGVALKVNSPSRWWVGTGLLPTYAWNGTDPLDESSTPSFAFLRLYATTLTTGLSVNEMRIGMQNLQQVHRTGSQAPYGDVWLIVFTPTIKDHVPATTTQPATTRPPATTRKQGVTGVNPIGTAETGVDIDYIATDLAEIIRNQRHQIAQLDVENRNSQIIANNTSELVNTLNLIYELMLQDGEIPVQPEPDGFDMGAIQSAIQGYTTARIPEQAEGGVRFLAALVQFINDELTWAAALGALGLALSVTCWILFRGRNA